jgi:hypothetical protein
MAPFVQAYSRASLLGSPTSPLVKVVTQTPAVPATIPSTPPPAPTATTAKSYPPNLNTDYESLWPLIALQTMPPGPPTDCGIPTWGGPWIKTVCLLRSIYYKGPCTAQAIQSIGIGASNAGAELNIGGQAAAIGTKTALTTTGMIAAGSAAIPVIGLGISAITSLIGAIFAHHAQAVQNEQEAECQVLQLTQQAIPQIDQAVFSGQITAAQGIALHLQVVNQAKSIEAPVSGQGSGGHPCNAGCCISHQLDALQAFAQVYYQDLSPASQQPKTTAAAPGSVPTQGGTVSSPSSSLSSQQVAASVAPVTNAPSSPSPAYQASVTQAVAQSAAPPPGSPTTSTSTDAWIGWVIGVLAVIGVILLARHLK